MGGFDAGAIVGRLKIVREDWNKEINQVKTDLQQLGQRVYALGAQFTSFAKNLSVLSRNMIFFGAGILTPLIAIFKSAENLSYRVRLEFDKLNTSFKSFRIEIADAMIPVVKQFNAIFSQFVKWFKDLPQPLKESYIRIALITGAVLVLAGTVGIAISNLIKLLGASFKILGMALMSTVSSPMLWIVAITGGIITAMWKWKNVSTIVFNAIDLSLQGLRNGFLVIKTVILEAVKVMWEAFEKLANFLATHFDPRSAHVQVWKSILEFYHIPTGVFDSLYKFGDEAKTISSDIVDNLKKESTEAWADLELKLEETRGLLKNMLAGKEGELAEKGNEALDTIKTLLANLQDLTKKMGSLSWEDTTDKLNDFLANMQKQLSDFYKSITDLGTFVGQQIVGAFMNIEGLISNTISTFIKTGVLDIKGFFAELGNYIIDFIAQMVVRLLVLKALTSFLIPSFPGLGDLLGIIPKKQKGGYIGHTGVYRLEEGESVNTRNDTLKKEREPMQIVNIITPEAVAMAMADKAGENVILNIINTNSLRNGMFRTEVMRR